MKSRTAFLLMLCGVVVLVYSMIVLGIVAAAPDLGIRGLLSDKPWANGVADGMVMLTVPQEGVYGKWHPAVGDRLIGMADWPINTFVDFTRGQMRLASEPTPNDAGLPVGADPYENEGLPALAQYHDGTRIVEIEFVPQGKTLAEAQKCYVTIRPLPLSEVLFSLVWFVLQSVAFAIGAAVYWNRPFDRASQLFYCLCLVTLGAFLGSNHWWIVAASFWLTAPCVICALLLPAVCLHFFLVFPRTWLPLVWRPRMSLALIYGLPIVGILGLLTLVAICSWPGLFHPNVAMTRQFLDAIRLGIYGSLVVGAIYFVITMARVLRSYRSSRNPVEQIQLQWLLGAGLATACCMGVTLFKALFERESFALGGGASGSSRPACVSQSPTRTRSSVIVCSWSTRSSPKG